MRGVVELLIWVHHWVCWTDVKVIEAQESVHVLVAAKPAATVVSVPVLIDDEKTPVEVRVREGEDWEAGLEALRREKGLSEENVAVLKDTIRRRTIGRGVALNERWFAVIASESDNMEATAASAAAHAGRGFRTVLVLDGFSLDETSRLELGSMFEKAGAAEVVLIETDEWEGSAAATERGLARVLAGNARSTIVVAFAGFLFVERRELSQQRQGEDIFAAYERVALSYGREGAFVATVSTHLGGGENLDVPPLLVLDSATASRLGPIDHGFLFAASGLAAWLDDAETTKGVHHHIATDTWTPAFVVVDRRVVKQETTVMPSTTAPPSDRVERLRQLDADMYYLRRWPVLGGLDRGEVFDDDQRPHPWLQRELSSLSLERARRSRLNGRGLVIAAMVCLYDDDRFVEAALADLTPRVHFVVVAHSTRPWFGPARDAGFQRAARTVARIVGRDPKVSVLRGAWPTEEAQRTAALEAARLLGASHVLLVDGDEFWHPVELDRALALVEVRDADAKVGYARATMATYWKSTRVVVDPPEPLRILWLVSARHADAGFRCGFSVARDWACEVGLDDGFGLSSADKKTVVDDQGLARMRMQDLGVYLDESVGVCHHLSYVRTDAEVEFKTTSFAHAADVNATWLDRVWRRWDVDPDLVDLHPTHPAAFKATRPQPLWALPPALRRAALDRRHLCALSPDLWDDDTALHCRRRDGDRPATSVRLDLDVLARCAPRNATDPTTPVSGDQDYSPCSSFEEEDDDDDFSPYESTSAATQKKSVDDGWTSLTHKRYVNTVAARDVHLASGTTTVDESDEARCSPAPRFVVLVVGEGALDASTRGVFRDAARVVAGALAALGANSRVAWCPDLRYCRAGGAAMLVVLGVHHLARYTYAENGVPPTPLVEAAGWPDPATSVLYNFEEAGKEDFGSPTYRAVLGRWAARGHLWDYSAANVLRLAPTLRAVHVPLGYHVSLEPETTTPRRDVDVLFVGRLEPLSARARKLRWLRDRGIRILHANSVGPVFGRRLDALIDRAKIVLSLRFWADVGDDEWKMTRYLPALARRALVVSETAGADLERRAWAQAVVFVATDAELLDALRFYLRNATARAHRAELAYRVLRRRSAATALRGPLAHFLRPLCPNATLLRHDDDDGKKISVAPRYLADDQDHVKPGGDDDVHDVWQWQLPGSARWSV